MTLWIVTIAGLLIAAAAASVAWLMASRRTEKRYFEKVEETQKLANVAEGRASILAATLESERESSEAVRKRAADDFAALREKLSKEEVLRAKAETEKADTELRLKEQKELLAEAQSKLTDAFKAIAGDTLTANSKQFLTVAKETLNNLLTEAKGDLGKRQEAIDGMVKPLLASLQQFDEHVRTLEKNRLQAYTSIEEHIKTLATSNQDLKKETGNLVNALRAPQVRGRWGEMQLRRVVELAGMQEHCDFEEQDSYETDDGRIRPDLVVHLPANRTIVVDAKVSLEAYLNAIAAETESLKASEFKRHANQVRTHMNNLASKSYWESVGNTPELVVMFIPGESFFAEAARCDPNLIEDGMLKKVVPASPTTLIALLHAMAFGWRQEQIAQNAQNISEQAAELYRRMRILAEHIGDIGTGLERANTAYNKAVGSIEARVLPSARRFKELGVPVNEEIKILEPLQIAPRTLHLLESAGESNGN